MIEFVTLFLGLAAGPQLVELSASTEVAEVRVLVDHREVAVDDEPPWQARIDLGSRLKPHLLEAVAFDEEGNELARTAQRLNIPRPPAEARITLERDEAENVVAARLTWESSVRRSPRQSRAWLDGEPLEITRPERILIPAHDKSQFHFLQVELEFSLEVIAQAQAVFGGLYFDESRADLTALPVVSARKSGDISPSRMSGWFQLAGRDLRVSAFDKGGLDLVLVRGPGVGTAVEGLQGSRGTGLSSGGQSMADAGVAGAVANLMNMSEASVDDRLESVMALEGNQRLRILAPQARARSGHSVAMTAFAISPEITRKHGGLYWALKQNVELPGLSNELRLTDAIAVAGLQAANGNRRRAVLLVLADEAGDQSRHSVREVRDYLASIQVPLFVWRVGEAAGSSWQEWGDGESVANFKQLRNAARQLTEALDRQRIVWLDGLYLPDEIEIGIAARVDRIGGP